VSEHLDALRAVVERYPADPRLAPYLAKVHTAAYKVTDRDDRRGRDLRRAAPSRGGRAGAGMSVGSTELTRSAGTGFAGAGAGI
jgi:protein-disulfide isomerase